MPIEALNTNNEDSNSNQPVINPEIVSQHTRYILGAKLEQADFQFIGRDNATKFAALPEGSFATDVDESGLNKVFRKINGERRYLAYERDAKAYLSSQLESLKPVVVKGSELPTSTEERLLYEGRTLIFLLNGIVDGREVQSGGTAYVLSGVEPGNKVTWDNLAYNEPSSELEVTPIELGNIVRLDGSAGSGGVTEKAVADAILNTRDEINSEILGIDTKFTTRTNNLDGRVSAAESSIRENEDAIAQNQLNIEAVEDDISTLRSTDDQHAARLSSLELKPVQVEEIVNIGDGASQVFKIALRNKFVDTPLLIWKILMGGSYVRISPQDGDISIENEICYLKAAFAGIPANAQFKVIVKGMVNAINSSIPAT